MRESIVRFCFYALAVVMISVDMAQPAKFAYLSVFYIGYEAGLWIAGLQNE